MSAVPPAVLNICRGDDDRNIGRKRRMGDGRGGELIPDVRFADDQGMICNSKGGLQRLIDRLNEVAKSYKMKINVKKTKTMIVSRTEKKTVDISIEGQKVEQVKKFKYLGAVISEDRRCIVDVKKE